MEDNIRPISPKDVQGAFELEIQGYPDDESASLNTFKTRQTAAPNLFLGFYRGDTLLGIVCGTRYDGERYDKESFETHQPDGESVCIHSVCVHPSYRRQGIALKLLKDYVTKVHLEEKGISRYVLVCKSYLIPLYVRAGFVLIGKSDLVHGKDTWYEMELKIK